jgi:hypothetical protein
MIFTISIMTNNRKQSFHNDNQQGYYNKQNDFCQNDTFKNIAAFKQQISQWSLINKTAEIHLDLMSFW